MSMIRLDSPVTAIYGIGPEAAKRLARLDILTVFDLISYLPRRYDDWSNLQKIGDGADGFELSFTGTIATSPAKKGYKKTSPVSFLVQDETGRIDLTFFNSPYLLDKFERGDRVFVHGTVTYYSGKMQMTNPHVERFEDTEGLDLIRPVYPLTAGLTSVRLSQWIRTALKMTSDQLRDVIPKSLAASEGLCGLTESYEYVHFPKTLKQAADGRKRIAYEELILLGTGIKKLNSTDPDEAAPPVIPKTKEEVPPEAAGRWKTVLGNLGFELTDDQKKAIGEIQSDLMESRPMNRLVQGDVGSGKTAVAILSMAMTAIMGRQSVLLAPTSVLAKQHYDEAVKLLRGSGINVVLLLGKTKAALKKEIKQQLSDNEASVIIGTHAVLSDDIEFSDLALVIADEQHRFGVRQREKLLIRQDDTEYNSVHNLVMTATPIPRTLAMVVYGDMDTSVIRQKPAGRQEIKTYFLPATDHSELYRVLRAKLAKGEQAYIVCTKIDDDHDEVFDEVDDDLQSDHSQCVSVLQMHQRLIDNGIAAEYPTGVLYGSMKENDKLEVMRKFIDGEIKLLVSTTVIEVGVNNPNATLMIIMDADRFGLSTLHQLRGRIGRGDLQSYCVLASLNKSEKALTRMKLMCETTDGFVLAGEDLKLRGPGDFFGTRQHGIPQLRAANLYTDTELAVQAREYMNRVNDEDPEEAAVLRENIKFMFDLRFKDRMGNL